MQSKPLFVWVCFLNMLQSGRVGKHHSVKRNMREGGNKKVLKVISSLISLDTVHMDIDVVC